MASIILRTLSPQVHRALKARAAQSGRTVEAEIVEIVEIAIRGKLGGTGLGMPDFLRQFGPLIGPRPDDSGDNSGP